MSAIGRAHRRSFKLACGIGAIPWIVLFGTALPLWGQTVYQVFTPRVAEDPATHQQPGRGAFTRVSLSVTDSPIVDVVREVARQAGMRVVYDRNNPLLAKRVTVLLGKVGVPEAIAMIVKGTDVVAQIAPDGETIVLHGRAGGGNANQIAAGVVTGRVTDSASGKGIGGATVTVQGTKLHTTTVESGQFVLRAVPAGEQRLTVRAFGYRPATPTVTVTDSERTTVRVVLASTPTVLSGMITTVTGVQQRQQVGTDITVLNADSIQRIAPVSTVTDMLEARVPGLTVLRESGVPGAPRRLRLRGTSSLERSNDPIMIVDGIRVFADQSDPATVNQVSGFFGPSPLDQIDPNSIETIEVFKGPSASALYGSDAGNGVIVITTKRGQAGRTRWTLSLDAGRTALPGGHYQENFFKFGSNKGFLFAPGSHICGAFDPTCVTVDSLVQYQALNDPRFDVFTHGQNRGASLTVSGGVSALTYSLTGSASSETGLFQLPAFESERFLTQHGFPAPDWMRHPDQYGTWGGNGRLDLPLGTGGSVALTTSVLKSDQQQSTLQNAIATLLGQYVDTTQAIDPVPAYSTRARLGTLTLTSGVTLTWPVRSWLPLNATAGLNVRNTDNRAVTPRDYLLFGDANGGVDSLGRYDLAQGQTLEQTLNAGTSITVPRHSRLPGVRMPVGLNVTNLTQSNFSVSAQDLPIGVLDPSALFTVPGTSPTQTRMSTATYGWYVAPTLDLNSRFFVSPGIRFDGGSASGAHGGVNGGNFSPFPKLDFSWLAVNQPDRPVLGAITLLRPRIAFGIAGVQPGPADKYRLFQLGTLTFPNGTTADRALLSALGNPELRPERSRELEGGVDAELWNQRVTMTLTPYYKLRYDAIYDAPVAPSILGGNYSFKQNVGDIRNTGVDATVGLRVLDNRSALWQLTTNIHKNTNTLVRLAPGVVQPTNSSTSGFSTPFVPGYPLNGVWAQPVAGFTDANHDGLIEPNEVRLADSTVFLGAQEPNYQLTASTTLSFFNGRLGFNTAVDYQNGLTQLNQAALGACTGANGQITGSCSLVSMLNDPHTSAALQAAIAAYAISPNGGIQGNGSAFGLVQTVNMVRWQSLSINYQAPTSFAHRFRVSSLGLALQGSNLGLHTNYRGKDPNVGALPGSNGISDAGQLPQPRLWQLRVTLGN